MEKIYIVIIFILVLLVISIIYSHTKIKVSRYSIKNKKIDKNLKLVFLSDLHNRNIKEKLLKIIEKEKADLIIFGGDMVNESIKEINNFVDLFKSINSKTMVYTFGNHERKMNNNEYNKYNSIINNSKMILLNNKYMNLSNNIRLYGLDSELNCYKNFKKLGLSKEYIENKISVLEKSKYNILIAHNPLEFDSYIDYESDFVLSGHVHGGLIKLPILGGVLSPDYTFFPKYSCGLYKKDKTTMIVSCGLGFSKRIKLRLFNPAEVVIISLEGE